MGLSASQARLLSLTARLSDLELRAQTISNAKIRLSDESESASRKYSNALDKQTLKVYSGIQSDGSATYEEATAHNLTTYNAISTTDKQRYIKNSSGSVIVSQDMAAAYNASNGSSELFLNNLGYSQYSPTERKSALKASSIASVSSDMATALSSISQVTNTALQSSTKSSLDAATAYLASSKASIATLGATQGTINLSQAASISALSTVLASLEQQLNTRYNTETDATIKAAILAETTKVVAAETALISNNVASAVASLQSVDVNVLSPKMSQVYSSNNNSYIRNSSGTILITQQVAKCIDLNPGTSDASLNGGIQPKSKYMSSLQASGLIASATDTSANDYKYYSKLYDMIDASASDGADVYGKYAIAEKSGSISESNQYDTGSNFTSTASIGANEGSTGWLQSQIDSGLATLYKLDVNTGVSTSQPWPANNFRSSVNAALAQAQSLQAQEASDASTIATQRAVVSTAINNLNGTLTSLYNATSDPAQKAFIYAQMGLAQTAGSKLTSGDTTGASNALNSMDIASLYNTLQTPVSTTYSSTLSPSAMASKLSNLSDDFAAISSLFTSSPLQSYDSGKQSALASLISQLSGSSISSTLCQSIQSVLNSISVSDLSTLIDNANLTKEYKYDKGLADYDVNIFNEIKESGGCISESDALMNSSEWLQSQIDAGNISLYEYNSTEGADGKGDNVNVSWTSGDATLRETTDSTDTARAEAEYETTMANIQSKDKRFDQQLTRLDTEHTATQTEVDSVKKVIDKNIERAFKMFEA